MNNPEILLERYFKGLTSAEENQQLAAWIAESDDHLRLAKQMNALCLAVDSERIEALIDTEKALHKVNNELGRREALPNRAWWRHPVAAAASITLVAVLAALWAGYEWASHRQMPVAMIEVTTAPGMTAHVTLPDSTRVSLNSESSLRYPAQFSGDSRRVELCGEAYFSVTHDKSRRFIVAAPHKTEVQVYGTRFNMEAYAQGDIATTLVEGSVGFFYNALDGSRKECRLTPGQKTVYSEHSRAVTLTATTGEVETSWKDGRIIFNGTPLNEVLRLLEKRYGVDFRMAKGQTPPSDWAFTGEFTSQRLDRILEYFQLSSGMKWHYVTNNDMGAKHQTVELSFSE